ncbi:acyl-CoA dehydrogenase family member 10 [Suncus etruscus]|uniref:acyl-CoA dehydrogenase family member 10 n=1 Tax=Suncus etruscus TaxID=109475 RepID=UPI00210FAE0F|nr:acyl-CoA dehydrogenase family member 10 [Suncus etruscus]
MGLRRLLLPTPLRWASRATLLRAPECRTRRWTRSASGQCRAVIFDMGGVLIPSPGRLAAEWEVKNQIPSGSTLKALIAGGENGPWMKFMRAEISTEQFLQEFRRHFSEMSETSVPVDSFFSLLTSERVAKQIPVMTEAITRIRAKGLQTAVLSNNFFLPNGKSFLPLDRKQFDVVVESCLEGITKPDPRIYKLCLDRLGVQPSESIFLDDLGPNLKAATSLGMRTIKVRNPEAAIEELEGLLGFALRSIPNSGPVRKNMEIPTESLQKYLRELLGPSAAGPMELLQFDHGQSNPTYAIRVAGQQLVLRKKPPGKLLLSAHAIEREFRIMKALSNVGVPVPKVLDLCTDSSVIGTPFYLMEYCPGIIYKDPSLPDLEPSQRQAIYAAMSKVLCQIHSVDLKAAGLEDYGKHENYIARQVQTWTKQYRASETSTIPSMERLIEWLPHHVPKQQRTTVVHGDFRLDNLIFHPEKSEVLAVLDWELSTLGDPLSDVAYSCLAHFLPSSFPLLKGLGESDLPKLGIPSAEQLLDMYREHAGIPAVDSWNFYLAFSFFRVAAILQGVYKRSLTGQASSANAKQSGKLTEFMSNLAWDFAIKEGFQVFKAMPATQPLARSYHTRASAPSLPSPPGTRAYCSTPRSSPTPAASPGTLILSPEGLNAPVRELYQRLKKFMDRHVYPAEPELCRHQVSAKKWTPAPLMEELKEKAKAEGLWNLFLPLDTDPERKYGAGLTNMEYAHLCELMGKSLFAPEIFNCSAPDTGNMEVLVRYGTEAQKARWLPQLLDGKARSCFAMTEPQVASSDATNIQSSIREEGDSYVINGRKWWISGSLDPRCELCIFMGKTDAQAPRHQQQTMLLVPMNTPGIKVLRPLTVYGLDDAPSGHGEVLFEQVRVPKENVLLGPGRGFEIAQGRLGPGRIHHCMRLIGYSERALALMKERAKSRVAFGKPLIEHGTILADIAQSRVEIEQARLLVLKAAHLMDVAGNKAAALEIAMIKLVAPSMAYRVIDRAIQAFGAAGLSSDYPLAQFFAWARVLRIADGPDEVHRATVAKLELKPSV